MLSFPLAGWASGESVQIKNIQSAKLKIASEAMQEIDILDMLSAAPKFLASRYTFQQYATGAVCHIR